MHLVSMRIVVFDAYLLLFLETTAKNMMRFLFGIGLEDREFGPT